MPDLLHALLSNAAAVRLLFVAVLLGLFAVPAQAQETPLRHSLTVEVRPPTRALAFRQGIRPNTAQILHTTRGTAASDTLLNAPDRDPWLAFDKAQHLAFSFLWTLGTQYTLVNKAELSEGTALPLSVAASAAVGIAKEVYDARSGRGVPSRRDLVADAVGIVLATGLILL